MKKVLIPLFVLLSVNTLAFAENECGNALCNAVNTGIGFTLAPFIATGFITSAVTTGKQNDKEAYVAALRDDAAQYLAEGGDASALLQSAFDAIKAQYPEAKDFSDEKLATLILDSN